jgi:outer membrane immunogenic protein
MRIFAISALALATVATPAFAQADEDSFTGGHIEVIGGIDHVSDGNSGDTGGVYGIAAGYDFDLGNLVGGIEGEAALSTANDCVGVACVEAGRDLYAGGRLGIKVGGRSVAYIKGGYTNARAKGTLSGTTLTTDDFDGVRVGVGAMTTVNGHFFVKAEYRYSNYEQGVTRHQGVVGVGFAF